MDWPADVRAHSCPARLLPILDHLQIYRELEKRDRSGKITSFSSGEAKYRPSSSSGPGGLTVKTGRPPSRSTASDTAGMLSPPISPATSLVSPSAPSFPGAPLAASSTGRGQSFALGAEELSVDASGPPAGDDGDLRPISQSSQLSTSGASGLVALTSDADDLTPAERRERKLRERQLVGSLTASFRFKEKGLIKKVRLGSSIRVCARARVLTPVLAPFDRLCP